MHWLPLVAMVIASALFFPHCPSVPRLVDATMEPGNNFSTRSLVNPISKSTNSHAEYTSSGKKAEEKLPHRTADTHVQTDLKVNGTSSFVNEDFSPESNEHKKAKPGRMDLELQTPNKLQEHHSFQENHILRDYTSTDDQIQEDSKLKTHIEDGTKDNGLNRRNEEVSVERLTLKEWPRDLYPADRPTTKEDPREVGRDGTKGNTLPMMPAVLPEGLGLGLDGLLQADDELLLLDTNPRVLFSTSPSPPKHPPLQIMLELGLMHEQQEEHEMDDKEIKLEKGEDGESYRNLLLDLPNSSEHATPSPRRRKREPTHNGIERSVCESISSWVMDRRTAIDTHRQNVTVLDKFPTKRGMIMQYFYETRCRGPDHRGVQPGEHGLAGAGCLGVDKRHWVSECQTKQSFVRAFTSDNTRRTGWRWIRIDTSCVCVLYSKTQRTRALNTRQGTR
ncbi:neurotrophin-3 [Neoarius graeffei]|uniref:neurotrophin-3 n=1 Tax=Neoarius graeffei TaxID=443677 RepID=UPI00298CDC6B|nr:neurotrophin-3 [Neoarius graeffei]XP_060758229.1 neurotrophin-3 [Neoarius graeffei]XP_060758230.1 neurotrophin-3 [Neoarius graeffei]